MDNYTKNRRADDRLIFPINYRPYIVINGLEYEVIDLSNGGIRFSGRDIRANHGMALIGRVDFRSNRTCTIAGRVRRVWDNEIAMQTSGIPEEIIESEREHYKKIGYFWLD